MLKILYENEVIMLFLGIGVFIFSISFRDKIKRICLWKNLMAGFYVLLVGWTLTILEAFYFEKICNFFEHVSYAVSSIIILIWCIRLKFGTYRKIC